MRLPPENLDGYSFMLLGKDCRICLTDEQRIRFDSMNGVVYLPRENARAKLVKWLKTNAKHIMTDVTSQAAERMGVTYSALSVGSAKCCWGTCTADNRIRYTFRLIYAPKEVIEYVAVHELSHVKHKNHSAAFWSEVEKCIPDWKRRRNWLKRYGILMEIF